MLAIASPFPHPGSRGYLKGTAEMREIIQRNADGTCTVKVLPKPFMTVPERLAWANRGASLTQRVPLADLFAHKRDAVQAGLKRRAAKRRAR